VPRRNFQANSTVIKNTGCEICSIRRLSATLSATEENQADGKGISLSPLGDKATRSALGGCQAFSGLNIFGSSLWRSSSL